MDYAVIASLSSWMLYALCSGISTRRTFSANLIRFCASQDRGRAARLTPSTRCAGDVFVITWRLAPLHFMELSLCCFLVD